MSFTKKISQLIVNNFIVGFLELFDISNYSFMKFDKANYKVII